MGAASKGCVVLHVRHLFANLAILAVTASALASSQSTLIRREDLQLDHHGAFSRSEPSFSQPLSHTAALDADQGFRQTDDAESDDSGPGMQCNVNYLLGQLDSSNCTNSGDEEVLDELECEVAAEQTGVHWDQATFKLSYYWQQLHPRGCFKYSCVGQTTAQCIFYNPIGDYPSTPRGTPMCKRPMFLNGTDNSLGGDQAGCPAGYSTIMNEDACLAAADCLGYCTGGYGTADFRVGVTNASKQELHPVGCFIDPKDSCFYFNPPSAAISDGNRTVTGLPMCKVDHPGNEQGTEQR